LEDNFRRSEYSQVRWSHSYLEDNLRRSKYSQEVTLYPGGQPLEAIIQTG
jgi:hypothetical protein